MINRVKKFKALIIDGRKIKIMLACASGAAIMATVSLSAALVSKKTQEVAVSESFYKTVISSQLHNESGGVSLYDIICAAVGFDITNQRSIIANRLPMFGEEFFREAEPPRETSAPTPTETSAPAATESAAPPAVQETKSKSDMSVSNQTSISVDPNVLASEELCFGIDNNGPQILIFHTHTTESFTDSDTSYLNSSDRNLDEEKNISAVGDAMAEVFENAGIEVIHDKTVHDYPSFNGAYTRSLATVRANLDKNPGIKVVLDIHRDGITREDGTKVKVAADINGEKTAQCLFVVGSNANLTHDNWRENMKLACKIQRLANEMYPGLMRPIILREERFNQQVSTGALIIEIGSNGNTLDEALRGGRLMADVIAKLLKKR